ncbi:MAG: 2-oxoacid:acceptor oxidoreductase subunit alpha [Hellea sp.]|nr:2-oxoacid:acceptor oxidoreductase subunit alpha [Hellea sp.]MBT5836211.1 2-oxoacid:acceptor oxidoreductase subunit alpha [Hellea sp.]MBT7399133.1 2-oxoacid:acceptor oxidoreductase subunit alpha [Hellea sp.]
MNEYPGIRLNDFVIKIGTVNGTGSASANELLMKTIFRMGVPVVGKNIFPSNIQGLPTWYEIRVTGDGHAGRSGDVDIMVAMNPESYERDLNSISSGGVLIYDSTWPRPHFMNRSDITVIGIPLSSLCNAEFEVARSRILMKNMAYVGAVAAIIGLDMSIIQNLINETFEKKKKLIPANIKAVDLGFNYINDNKLNNKKFFIKALNKTSNKIMIDGNTAAGLGAVYAGATFGSWYPITPSTSLMDSFSKYCNIYRKHPKTNENLYCIIQAEDELSAAGMAMGAAWNGARAFTPTSGAGISLMSEFIGFAYYAEVGLVYFDIQRVGPSTGMPTRTQQCDINLTAYASHGDTKHIVLYPAHPGECFTMSAQAFDLAERFQTPVFFLSDLDIGMNDWMVDELEWEENYTPDRGKIMTSKQLADIEVYSRYLDIDGDYIPYRTLPGTDPKGAYFLRGSGHNKYGKYTEISAEYKEVVDRLLLKWKSAAPFTPQPIVFKSQKKTNYGVIAIGSSDGAVREACINLEKQGVYIDYMRIRSFPFADSVEEFIIEHDLVFIVEQNRDAQLMNLLLTETNVPRENLVSVKYYAGQPLNYKFVYEALFKGIMANSKNKKTA